MNYLSVRFLLPKIEINGIMFSLLNVKITLRGRTLNPGAHTGAGWLLNLPEMKRIEKIVSRAYEKYTISISSERDRLHELGTEQSIAQILFEAAESFLTDEDQFEIHAAEIEGFGKYAQYACRFCPFDSMVDQLINTSIKNGIASDVGEQIIEAAKVSHKEVFGVDLEPEAADLMRKMIKNQPIIAGGFCNIDPRDEMNSAEYQAMVRNESTGTFQKQKFAAFNPDESRRLAFDRDHEDHLLQLNAEDSILFVDVNPNRDRIRLISYFVGLDELYVIEQFTDATKDKFSFETIARAAIINIKRRIEENRVAESTVWLDPFAANQFSMMLQAEGIRVHELRRINPISEKIKTALRLMEHKAAAKRAPDPKDRSCDFCFYPLQNKEIVSSDQIFDSLFCSRECLNNYANKQNIELRRAGDPILSNSDRPDPRINRAKSETALHRAFDDEAAINPGEKMLLEHIGKNTEKIKEKLFSPEAVDQTDFCDITKHLLKTVEVDAPPRQTIHIIAPDSKGCAALIQSLLLSHPFDVDVFVHEFNDEPEVIAQMNGLKMINAEFEPKNGLHGVSEPLHISEQFLIELKQRNQKLLAVYDPGNLGLFAPKSRDYFGQMRFDVIEAIAEFNPRIVEKRNKSPEPKMSMLEFELKHSGVDRRTTAAERGNVTASDVEAIAGKYSIAFESGAFPPLSDELCPVPELETVAVNAPDPMFAGDVQEFIAEETERIENVEVLPNVENSTMAETPADEVVKVASKEIFDSILQSAACPICKAWKGAQCSDLEKNFDDAVHSARITACAQKSLPPIEIAPEDSIALPSLLKPAVVVGDLLDLPDVDEMKFRTIPAPDPNYNYTCEHCPAILQSCPHYRVENIKEADQITTANDELRKDIGNFRQFLFDEFEVSQYKVSSMQAAAALLRYYKKLYGTAHLPALDDDQLASKKTGDVYEVGTPEAFSDLINAVYCTFCDSGFGVECSSATEPIFSPMAASVHCARKIMFDLFILTTKGQFAPIKILSESARATVIEKVSCGEPFCNAFSGGFKNESQGESCVYSADQRPDQLSTIENGVHLSRYEKYRDL